MNINDATTIDGAAPSEKKSHAEIVAECYNNTASTQYVRKLLDRLEAAHRREIEATAAKCCQLGRLAGYGASEIKHQQEPVGNSAKQREALELIVSERGILDFCHNNLGSKTCEDWDKVYRTLRKWIDEAMSALAALPRNCDRYASAEEAWDAYDEWADSYRSQGKTEPFNEVGWLFATAPEQKGGSYVTSNNSKAREVLNRVHEFLSNLCRDARCDDHCSECLDASDLADDVYDLLHAPEIEKEVRNDGDKQ